jgi:hypothetical protein
MNRHLFLAFLIVFISLTNSLGYGQIHPIAVQENTISDNNNSDDYLPLDNIFNGKLNIISQDLVLIIFLILNLTKSINLLIKFIQRYVILIPIFYQSNYVDTPLLKK